jgi:hypothetical protein
VPSKIVFASSDTTVMKGGKVTLVCSATGYPPPTAKWIRNNRTIASGISSANYTIKGIQFDQTGEYVCVASNDFGSSNKTTFIRVRRKYYFLLGLILE